MAYDLDLATDGGPYSIARAADGYSRAEDLSAKNTAGAVLTAVGFGLLGLIKLAQHGRDMDEEAARLASKYQGVSADQAEHVMRRLAGTFAVDDDPAELARQADSLLSRATAHGYTGGHVAFLLDYCSDKGMSAGDAVAYMTAKEPFQVLHDAYTEVGGKVIMDAIARSASKLDSPGDAEAFTHQLIDKMVRSDTVQSPQEVADLISSVARYADYKPTSSELIEAVGLLGSAGARTGYPASEIANVLYSLDHHKDTGSDGALALAKAAAPLLDAARASGTPLSSVRDIIYGVDRYEDAGRDTAASLAQDAARLLAGMKAHGVGPSDATNILYAVDRFNDRGGQTSGDVVDGALKVMEAMRRDGVSRSDAHDLLFAVDRYNDAGGQTGSEVVSDAVRLMDAMKAYKMSRSDASDLLYAVDRFNDRGGQTGTDVVDGAVKLMEAMRRDGISKSDAHDLLFAVDRYNDRGGQTGTEVVDGAVRLMEAMHAKGLGVSKVKELMYEADRSASGQSQEQVVEETVRRMK